MNPVAPATATLTVHPRGRESANILSARRLRTHGVGTGTRHETRERTLRPRGNDKSFGRGPPSPTSLVGARRSVRAAASGRTAAGPSRAHTGRLGRARLAGEERQIG